MTGSDPAGRTALVVGVGPGLGWALAQRFAAAGLRVAVVARSAARLRGLLDAAPSDRIRPYACDATDAAAVAGLFEAVQRDLGEPELVVYNAGAFQRASVLDITVEDFEHCWRVGCLGGFLVGQAAARAMVARAAGTIVFTGATASLRGSAHFANLAVPKFGLRALAQSMARELGPAGVHVAHVIVDGQIESERYRHLATERPPDALLAPAAIADTVWQLHGQHRSAWTQELDLRPWTERF